MNLKARLRHLSQKSQELRQYGKTTLLAKITKELDGVLLCRTHKQATEMKKAHGVNAISFEKNLEGIRGPFFFDHYTLETLLDKAANKIDTLENDNFFLANERNGLKRLLEQANKEIDRLRAMKTLEETKRAANE